MRLVRGLRLLTLAAALSLAGCTQYASVSKKKPVFTALSAAGSRLAATERKIADAFRASERRPLDALGTLLKAADTAAAHLARNPGDAAARNDYNFAVARVMGIVQNAKLDPWSKPLRVPADDGEYVLTHKHDPRPGWNPALYQFTPADEFDIRGAYVKDRKEKIGLGAPLVATGRTEFKNAKRDFTIPRIYYGVTAVIRFQGRKAEIAFVDPLSTERITLAGHSHPLAADFTVPLAVMLASTEPKKFELARLLRPAEYAETARIARLQPYDPEKTVVLVVHGLMDSPATWTPMINTLRADEEIRRNYQFWFYSYPSGYPYPHSAAILRRELDAIQQRFPLRKKMVVIGHSMGGCISRLLITDTGDKIWIGAFKKPPQEVAMPADSKKLFQDAVIFRHRPEVGRVIFISAPLKGADLAQDWVGRLGTKLVKSPTELLKAGRYMLNTGTYQDGDLRLNRIPNSVDTLAPNNHFVRAINQIPVAPGIPYHVICGDRGKGGNRDRTKPVMSDGVVPYWSSHMEGARSERIVPSNHSAHQHPEAIAEVRRILIEHPR